MSSGLVKKKYTVGIRYKYNNLLLYSGNNPVRRYKNLETLSEGSNFMLIQISMLHHDDGLAAGLLSGSTDTHTQA